MNLQCLGRVCLSAILLAVLTSAVARAEPSAPFPLRDPSISKNKIAFTYAGSIWTVNHDGSSPQRLTNEGKESMPSFSPDGSQIAFVGNYDGTASVYVIPSSGGDPRRLTYHPNDFPNDLNGGRSSFTTVTWTPDGKRIVFSSPRVAPTIRAFKLFEVPIEGGFAAPLPLSRGTGVSFSADGARIAYLQAQNIPLWKHYRGGATSSISIARLPNFLVQDTVPRDNSNDFNPMWIGDSVYFLSDRNGPTTLFSYNTNSRQVQQVIQNKGFDIRSAAASSNDIVYEQFGELHVLNLESRVDQIPDIRLSAKSEDLQPHFQKISPEQITAIDVSPSGDQVALAARGEIFALPVHDENRGGRIKNLTRTVDALERGPAWSPDGRSVAYFSDASGEYALHILDQRGMPDAHSIKLEAAPSPYYSPSWSPDSKKIAYIDKDAGYWYVDLQTRKQVRLDSGVHFFYMSSEPDPELTWSPDSRWIAYTKEMPSRMHAIFIHFLESGRSYQVTDSTVDALHVAFDKGGQYLYLTLSSDVSLVAGISMSGYDRPVTRYACLMILRKDAEVPILRRQESGAIEHLTGENLVRGHSSTTEKNTEASKVQLSMGSKTQIDFDGIDKRIWTLPIPARNYYGLYPGPPGILFLLEGDQPVFSSDPAERDRPDLRVQKFDLNTLETTQILSNVSFPSPFHWPPTRIATFHLSYDGSTILYQSQNQWFVIRDGQQNHSPQAETVQGHALNFDDAEVYVDPRAEWAHIYDQVWRGVRDFFYDPGLHGLNLEAAIRRYRPYLGRISTRLDLNYLFEEMLGNLTVSHLGVIMPPVVAPGHGYTTTGLLGADYSIENGRYRFAQVYGGESWNPALRAPLIQPGAEVQPGEYLLTVNGRDVFPSQDIYSFFQGTAGNKTVVGVGVNQNDRTPRNITVIPIDSEANLRTHAWVESNRREVDELTNGRVGYLYLSDVTAHGYRDFNRYYFAQSGKDAVIIDERYDGGGWAPDYIIDMLRRPLLNFFHSRSGHDMTIPTQGIFGPKVMIVNEQAGSGGDHLAYMFRKAGLGPLVGKRTYGGLIGACAWEYLLDGSLLLIPSCAFYTPDGAWSVENNGVEPDIQVEEDPRPAHDSQLEASIKVMLDLLKKAPATPAPMHPPYPRYQSGRR